MRKLYLFMAWFLPLLFPVSVFADYYSYVDDSGVIRYVDVMSKVPKAYQDQVVYHVVPTSVIKDTAAQKPMGSLLKHNTELDEEYSILMKEKEALLESIREWEGKYKVWENKKSAFDEQLKSSLPVQE